MRKKSLKITLQEFVETWGVLRSVCVGKGIDLQRILEETVGTKEKWLSEWGCEADFDALCEAGCNSVTLVTALWIIHSAPNWSRAWRLITGQKRSRDQISSALDRAALALTRIERSFDMALTSRRTKQQRNEAKDNQTASQPNLANSVVPDPKSLVHTLRSYSRVARIFDDLAKSGIRSPEAFGKYLLCAFVKSATTDYHDAEVSSLIGGALAKDYNADAHRMWRRRNYKQIERVSFPVELLVAFGIFFANTA
jgi:hypothetical protein